MSGPVGGGPASWLADLAGAVEEVATTALGLHPVAPARPGPLADALHGAYLGLVGPAGAIQIGLASSPAGCQALAKGLLGMGPEDAALPEGEMADAVCELVNIVAGAFKARVRDRASPLQLGLPVFIQGSVQPTERVAVSSAEITLGPIAAVLLLVHPRPGGEA